MAYICKRKNREGKYYVYLTETYRIGDKTRTRNLKSYGSLDKLESKEPGAYERLRKEAKAGLLTEDISQNLDISLDLNELISQDSKYYGWLFLDELYSFLGIGTITKKHSINSNFEYDLDKILKLLVFGRILSPNSKLKTVAMQENLYGEWNLNIHDVYRSLGELPKIKNDIGFAMHNSITSSVGREATLVFYDVTNYYFQTDYDDLNELDEDGNIVIQTLRKRGPSKEKQPKPIVQMGLFMDMNGIPISYKLFPGNNTDPITYIPAIEQVKKQYGIKRIVTVADKAMNSSKNVTDAHSKGDGWLFSQKIRGTRGVAKELQEFALDKTGWKFNEDLSYGIKSMYRKRKLSTGKTVEEKVLVTWSEKYARRERIRRNGALEYASKLTNAELFRITSKKGGKRYLKQMVIEEVTGKKVEMNPFIELDMEKADYDAMFDGLNVIVTSEKQMSDEQMLASYRNLTRIEDCFRVTKTELDARPIYVWTDEHIEAHFLTCFISLVMLRMIKHATDNQYSERRIIEALQSAIGHKYPKGYYRVEANKDLVEINKELKIKFSKKNITEETLKRYAKGWCSTFRK